MLSVLLIDEIDKYGDELHQFTYNQIKGHSNDRFECHKGVNLISFDWIDVRNPEMDPSEIIIYFSADRLIFFCENDFVLKLVNDIVEKKELKDETNEMILYTFFSEIIKTDTDNLEKLEDEVTAVEESVVLQVKEEAAKEIVDYRNITRTLRKYYDELGLITDGLSDNENGLISENYTKHFTILEHRVNTLIDNVKNLREYVTQVREAYQAQIDIEQNRIMKVFTIISGIFLPLTLLVGWYGMNLRMPEFRWTYGYPLAIILSVVIVIVCLIFFKRKKWM